MSWEWLSLRQRFIFEQRLAREIRQTTQLWKGNKDKLFILNENRIKNRRWNCSKMKKIEIEIWSRRKYEYEHWNDVKKEWTKKKKNKNTQHWNEEEYLWKIDLYILKFNNFFFIIVSFVWNMYIFVVLVYFYFRLLLEHDS